MPSLEPPPESLWSELLHGTAGVGTRLFLTLALFLSMLGLTLIGVYALSYMFSNLGYSPGRPYDETVAVCLTLAGAVFVLAMIWVWSKPPRFRGYAAATGLTMVVWLVVIPAGIGIEQAMSGDEELMIAGVVLIGFGATVAIWGRAFRRRARQRARNTAADGELDLRCPTCSYRMVGLSESRCPECGQSFTLDELYAGQAFFRRDLRRSRAGAYDMPMSSASMHVASTASNHAAPASAPPSAHTSAPPSAPTSAPPSTAQGEAPA